MFISEVLFVSESVVSRLHQQHRDKETPPLLAFPWFGAQFLSHAFLALERDRRFTHITRFLNLADLAPHVSGTGYTFFVPTDTAFEEIGLDKMPDNYLSTGDGLEILLNHFVKGRLYDRDLKDNLKLLSLGNKIVDIGRRKGNCNGRNPSEGMLGRVDVDCESQILNLRFTALITSQVNEFWGRGNKYAGRGFEETGIC